MRNGVPLQLRVDAAAPFHCVMLAVFVQFLEKFDLQNRMMMAAVTEVVEEVKSVRDRCWLLPLYHVG